MAKKKCIDDFLTKEEKSRVMEIVQDEYFEWSIISVPAKITAKATLLTSEETDYPSSYYYSRNGYPEFAHLYTSYYDPNLKVTTQEGFVISDEVDFQFGSVHTFGETIKEKISPRINFTKPLIILLKTNVQTKEASIQQREYYSYELVIYVPKERYYSNKRKY